MMTMTQVTNAFSISGILFCVGCFLLMVQFFYKYKSLPFQLDWFIESMICLFGLQIYVFIITLGFYDKPAIKTIAYYIMHIILIYYTSFLTKYINRLCEKASRVFITILNVSMLLLTIFLCMEIFIKRMGGIENYNVQCENIYNFIYASRHIVFALEIIFYIIFTVITIKRMPFMKKKLIVIKFAVIVLAFLLLVAYSIPFLFPYFFIVFEVIMFSIVTLTLQNIITENGRHSND